MIAAPVAVCEDPVVHEGAALLSGVGSRAVAGRRTGGGTTTCRRSPWTTSSTPSTTSGCAVAVAQPSRSRTKLGTAAEQRGRPVVVVNLSEGEPASSKDTALARTRPHLVLDGAVATARALGARQVHVVLPGDRPLTAAAMEIGDRTSAGTAGSAWCATSRRRGSSPGRREPCSS